MRDKKIFIGAICSLLWIAFAIYMIATGTKPEKLSEWGDFFSGFFSPIAILWLVLGYLQQGDELRNSSEALQLQATELKNSVEQQSALVEVSRLQLAQEKKAMEDERERRKAATRPVFVPNCSSAMTANGITKYEINIRNVGSTATDIVVDINPKPNGFSGFSTQALAKEQQISLGYVQLHSYSTVTVDFYDIEGTRISCEFPISIDGGFATFGRSEYRVVRDITLEE